MGRYESYGDERERYAAEREHARHRRDPDFGPGGWRGGAADDAGRGIPLVGGMPAAYGAPAVIGAATPDAPRSGYGPYAWAGSGSDGRHLRHEHEGREPGLMERAADAVSSWLGGDDHAGPDHRGRGPKGWTRSDERIHDDVCHRLTEDDMVDASDVEVTVAGGEVTLNGTVQDRMQKRRAEDCAEAASGVRHVQNNLRVANPTSDAGSRRIL
jgi:hypothetical protein